ncbi:MAG: hypothetical protein P8016_15310 [Sedimentisphaerales bacterium]
MELVVISNAIIKLTVDCNFCEEWKKLPLDRIVSKTARETIKTTVGSKKAVTTL